MKEIILDKTNILIDNEDEERILTEKWHLTPCKHFHSFIGRKSRKMITTTLQRFILGYKGPLEVAHKDGNHFNFQKDNLIPMTHRQNMQNCSNNTSGHAGVYQQTKQKKSWCATIWINGKNKHLGSFFTIEEAITARRKAEQSLI